MKKLSPEFYLHADVVHLAKELLGKILVTNFNGLITSGRIVETEAYAGGADKASHAYKGKTPRTTIMFGEGGSAYIYLCYGIHQMFNIVTNQKDIPHAILVRAVEPVDGLDIVLARTGKIQLDSTLTRGPGNVGKALGFHTSQTGTRRDGDEIFIADDGFKLNDDLIGISPRIGVAYAAEDAMLPYRFFIKGNKFVSGKIK